MKKYTLTLGILLIFVLVLTACFDTSSLSNIFNGEDGHGEAGYGKLRISFIGRTIFPDKVFDSLEYTITPDGTVHTHDQFGLFTLPVGTAYTIDVKAFVNGEVAATGTSVFDIVENKITSISINLQANEVFGTGTFSYYIEAPAGAVIEKISLQLLPDLTEGQTLVPVINEGIISQTVSNVPAGFYLFTIRLELNGRVAGKGKAVHIYDKMVSNYGTEAEPIVFENDDFINRVPVTEIIVRDNSNTQIGMPLTTAALTIHNDSAITLFVNETRNVSVSPKFSGDDIWADIDWTNSSSANVALDKNAGGLVAVTGCTVGSSVIIISAKNDDNTDPVTLSFTVNVKAPPTLWLPAAVNPLGTAAIGGHAVGKGVMVIGTTANTNNSVLPPGKIYWSEDGNNWTEATGSGAAEISALTGFRSVTFGTVGTTNPRDMFIASCVGNIYTSEDGKVWAGPIPVTLLSTNAALSMAITGGTIYLGGNWFCYSSSDGINWVNEFSPGTVIRGMAAGNGILVGVCDSGNIRTRSRAGSWFSTTAGGSQLMRAAYGNGVFVAVGSDSAAVSVNEGLSWSILTANNNGLAGSTFVAFGDGYFAAGAADGTIRFSSNGIDWSSGQASTVPITNAYGAIEFFAGKWIVGGNSGTIGVSQ